MALSSRFSLSSLLLFSEDVTHHQIQVCQVLKHQMYQTDEDSFISDEDTHPPTHKNQLFMLDYHKSLTV